MFKRTRRKIVAAIMTVLALLWTGTLGVIYTSSYFEMKQQNEKMMEMHSEMYVLSRPMDALPPDRPRPDEKRGSGPGSPMFRLSIFYTVAVSHDGNILEIKNEPPTLYTDDDLRGLAQSIIAGSKRAGTKDDLDFYKEDKGGYTLVTFMDNTIVNENAMTLFRYTLRFGAVALVLFFFLSVYLARRIVDPLEKSYQKQKQFISDAGHELKTPVSVISANAELLSREVGESQWLTNIQYENERMATLVAQLLDLARTESAAPQMEHIDLSRLVAGEVLPFESVAFEKGLVLSSNVADNICVEGDSTQLKQIVSILLDNAIRHSTGHGEVHLSLTKEHGSARLSVINKGDEIPLEQRRRIFERFYRLDTVRNGEDDHYGLGLAIARAIAVSHKGRIEVLCHDGLVDFRFQVPAK